MTNQDKLVSIQLDEAREMEEHYRALLIFWKQRRQRLESLIPTDSIFEQILHIAQRAWRNGNNAN